MRLPARRLLVALVSGSLALAAGIAFLVLRAGRGVVPLVQIKIEQDDEWTRRMADLEELEPAVWVRAFPDSTLKRERVPPGGKKAKLFIPLAHLKEVYEYDEDAVYRLPPRMRLKVPWPEHPDGRFVGTTNSAGLRMDREVARVRPDLRVLLTGDSHLEGVCNNRETTAAVLGERLAALHPEERVEVLNAAVGGYTGYNELGVLERHLPDGVDAFVQVVYGGNDFAETLPYRHFYERTRLVSVPGGYQRQMTRATEDHPYASGQALNQASYLTQCPGEARLAVRTMEDLVDETARLCAHHAVRYLLVYLPSAAEVEWDAHRELFEPAREAFGLTRDDALLADTLADELLAHAGDRGVEVLDARPLLRAGGPYFWKQDLHLNVAGHARLAEAIAARLSADD